MKIRLITCLVIGVGLFGTLGAAYSHSPLPLVVMLLLGGVIIGVSTMGITAKDVRVMVEEARYDIYIITRQYRHKPQHSLKLNKRVSMRLRGVKTR